MLCRNNTFNLLNQSTSFLVGRNKLYFLPCYSFNQALKQQFHQNRLLRQRNKSKLIYNHEPKKLIQAPIELKQLVPQNIFQQQVLIEEYEKFIVQDKKQNHLQNSYGSMNLNIAENKQLRTTLMRYTRKDIRIGRLLQIMDMVAGLVSYRHCFGSFKKHNPFTLVTGSVQSLQFFEPINCQQNIQIQGFMNYSGKTSMEIQVNINQAKRLKGNCFFTMVCRNSTDLSTGFYVPKLDISRLPEQQLRKAQQRLALALEHINRRKRQISESFDIRPPSHQQIGQIHQLFLQQKSINPALQKRHKISSTHIQTNQIMHLQDRNIHSKIFGGFLMRQMLEIGWFAGKKFIRGETFEIEGITDIYFLSAVEIGDGLTISAAVTYTQGNIMIVTVQAHTTSFKTGDKKLCCSCQLIFQTKMTEIQSVYPDSYAQALTYLNSRRTFNKMFGKLQYNI